MIEYVPSCFGYVDAVLPNPGSAWRGLEMLIMPIIMDFGIARVESLEFGVEGGYSTAALAHHFYNVTAVDHFRGDEHSGIKPDAGALERETRAALASWSNIEIVADDCFSWMLSDKPRDHYDLCHIDIVHTLKETLAAALWACDKSDVVILHDTESFPDVKYACELTACHTGRIFYNWPKNHGLGILVKQ